MNKTAAVTIAVFALLAVIFFRSAAQNAGAAQEPIQAGHTHDVIRVKWSPDDERFISYSGGDDYIRLWEVKTARLLWSARTTFIQQKDEHYALTNFAWSSDQSLIASGSGNGMIQVWDALTGKLRWNVRAHAEYVNTLAFSQDGKYLVSSGLDESEKNEIKTWRVVNGSLLKKFGADPGVVIAILVSADGTRLKAGNLDGDAEAATWEGKIRISFESYGEPIDLMSARLAEPSKPYKKPKDQSAQTASGIWLRLRNDSNLPIAFSTVSMYLNRSPKCGYKASAGKFFEGLCDGAEVNIQYGVQDATGEPVPWGFDFGAISMLPPGASVVFSVMRDHLEDGRSIRILYSYQKEGEKRKLEDYGSEHRVYFKASDLPR